MVRAESLWKIYGEGTGRRTDVLRGISIEIQKGEWVAVAGPSGAGKTTLLNLLSGMDRPTRGEVWLAGQRQSDLSEGRKAVFRNRRIGMVFQFYHLLQDLSVLENVMLPGRIAGRHGKALRERSQQLLSDLGLADRSSYFPSELSGGQMQRAAIARALVNDPEMIFCDEPTGNLDSANGEMICRYLKLLTERDGKTVVIVTHDDKIAESAPRILRMKDGRMAGDQRF